MAKESGQEKSLQQLRQDVARSRDTLARDLSGLRYELDFSLKFRKSFQRQTVVWVTAAVVIGVVFAVLPARKRKVRSRVKMKASAGDEAKTGILSAGLVVGALKLAATLLKPAVTRYISRKVSDYASSAGTGR